MLTSWLVALCLLVRLSLPAKAQTNECSFPITTCRMCTVSANCTDPQANRLNCMAQISQCPVETCPCGVDECIAIFIGFIDGDGFRWQMNTHCGTVTRIECRPEDPIEEDMLFGRCRSGCVWNECPTDVISQEFDSTVFGTILKPPNMTTPTPAPSITTTESEPLQAYVIYVPIIIILAVLIIFTTLIVLIVIVHKMRPKIVIPRATRGRSPSPIVEIPTNTQSWRLQERIGHGRYGFVYKAQYNGETVAVKLFTSHARAAWETETNLYSMESTAHKSLLEYITSETRGSGILRERALVTKFYPLGSLNSYLKENIVSWQQACQMIHSIAQGLAHLHSEYYVNSAGITVEKYCVAHRDMKSANILVQDDSGDCVISDLGFALILDGKEASNTAQAGTYRYMAPEALDARVNLQDLQSFKQIDVYAFALIMWEVMSRTCVLTEEEVPRYHLPYEEEAGLRPTLDRLKDIVVTRKLRPTLPAIWGNHEYLSSLQETLHECWDDDAEARLSAANVSLRMQQLVHTNINDIARQDSVVVTTVPISGPSETVTRIEMNRPGEHSQSSPPPYYSPTDPIPFQFDGGPVLSHQRYQVSMPHIFPSENDQGSPVVIGHLTARCTRSLRSSYHYEQEMMQMNSFNRSEFLTVQSSLSLHGEPTQEESEQEEEEEVIRDLSQSPYGTLLEERGDICQGENGNEDCVSLDGLQLGTGLDMLNMDDYELASNLHSDSGILNTNSDLSHSTTTPPAPSNISTSASDQGMLTDSLDSGLPSTHDGLPTLTSSVATDENSFLQ